jgi:CBS-domain-containing membrane protein
MLVSAARVRRRLSNHTQGESVYAGCRFYAPHANDRRPEELVRIASQRMRGNNIRHLPVVTGEGMLVGIITDRNLRQASASDEPHLAADELTALLETLTVQEIMTRQVTTVRRHTPIVAAQSKPGR